MKLAEEVKSKSGENILSLIERELPEQKELDFQ